MLGDEVPRPFVKYAGGKDQLLPELLSLVPKGWSDTKLLRYHEPFLGGGALLLALWRLTQGKIAAWAADSNAELIDAWWEVTNHPKEVMEAIDAWPSDERTFYRIRAMKPWKVADRIVRAARTIYLNKNCYNGLFRLGPGLLEPERRNFNVPWGKRPGIKSYDRANFWKLKGVRVSLRSADFRECSVGVVPGDLIYFDPPYLPVRSTSMTDYGSGKFGLKDHEDLAELFDALVDRGAYCMLSNADLPWVRERYSSHRVHPVVANRAINRDGAGRAGAGEVVVVGFRE